MFGWNTKKSSEISIRNVTWNLWQWSVAIRRPGGSFLVQMCVEWSSAIDPKGQFKLWVQAIIYFVNHLALQEFLIMCLVCGQCRAVRPLIGWDTYLMSLWFTHLLTLELKKGCFIQWIQEKLAKCLDDPFAFLLFADDVILLASSDCITARLLFIK